MSNQFFKVRLNLWGVLSAAGTLACVFTALGFLGRFWWLFDGVSHFRFHYAAGLMVLALASAVARKFKPGLIFGGFALVNAVIVLPYCFTGRSPEHGSHTPMRVVLVNVRTENGQPGLVEAFVRQSKPDVLVLQEVNEHWLERLMDLRDLLPHSHSEPRTDNFGIALLSRLPLTNAQIRYLGAAEVPSVSAGVEFPGTTVTVLATHPLPPAGAEDTRLRDEQLEAVAKLARQEQNPLIVVGDLNVTPWSYAFRDLLQQSGLSDSGRGFGYQASWPAMLLPLRVPIDHCLVSAPLQVLHRELGPNVGSDHLPLVIDIGVPQPAKE